MGPSSSTSPDWSRLVVSPSQAPTDRDLRKFSGSSTAVANEVAVTAPTPGTAIRIGQASLRRALATRCRPSSAARKRTAREASGAVPPLSSPSSCRSIQQMQTGEDEDRQEGRLRHNEDDSLAADVEDRAKARLHAHRRNCNQQGPAGQVAHEIPDDCGDEANGIDGARARNASTKPGTSGGRGLPASSAPLRARMAREKHKTTGASRVTRKSLTSVAVSPVSSEMEKPAPTTWATS